MKSEPDDPTDLLEAVPVLDEKWVDWLKIKFPLTQPEPVGTEREDCYRAGQQSVISALIDAREYQLERARELGIHQILP